MLVLLLAAAAQRGEAPVETLAGIQERIAQSDFAAARAQIASALRRYPADARLYNARGILSAQTDDYAGAETAFREAVRLAPGLTGAWLNLGRLYQTHLDRDARAAAKGIEVYKRMLAAKPALAEANYQLALLLQWRGEFRESLIYLGHLPEEERARPNALALRCAGEAGAGNTAGALAAARALLARPDLDPAGVMAIVPTLEKSKSDEVLRLLLPRARAAYEQVARANPNAVAPLLDLARVASKQRDYEGALGYLAHARDIEPDNAGIHFLFGITANELRLPMEAKKSLEKALQLAPGNPYYQYAMGVVGLHWTDKQPAIENLKKYTAAKPDDPRGHLALATAHFLLYEFDAARQEVAQFAKEPSMRATAQYLLGSIAREDSQFDAAASHLKAALELAPDMTEARAELALVMVKKEDYAGAEREANAVLSREPDNFSANQALMQTFRNTRDPRLDAQAKKFKSLVEDRSRRVQLMLRGIEVRP